MSEYVPVDCACGRTVALVTTVMTPDGRRLCASCGGKPLLYAPPAAFPIRAGAVTDRSFIFDSWRHSFWAAPSVRGMGRDQYFADMGKRVEARS